MAIPEATHVLQFQVDIEAICRIKLCDVPKNFRTIDRLGLQLRAR
jgi:hypothetical protein